MTDSTTMIRKRIRLIYTDDQYTRLRTGDTGTITDVTELPKVLEAICNAGVSGIAVAT